MVFVTLGRSLIESVNLIMQCAYLISTRLYVFVYAYTEIDKHSNTIQAHMRVGKYII